MKNMLRYAAGFFAFAVLFLTVPVVANAEDSSTSTTIPVTISIPTLVIPTLETPLLEIPALATPTLNVPSLTVPTLVPIVLALPVLVTPALPTLTVPSLVPLVLPPARLASPNKATKVKSGTSTKLATPQMLLESLKDSKVSTIDLVPPQQAGNPGRLPVRSIAFAGSGLLLLLFGASLLKRKNIVPPTPSSITGV